MQSGGADDLQPIPATNDNEAAGDIVIDACYCRPRNKLTVLTRDVPLKLSVKRRAFETKRRSKEEYQLQ